MIFLKLLSKLIKILRAGGDPRQIAGGFMLGMMLGLLSFRTLFAAPILLVIILINVNLASAVVALILFRVIAYIADPLIHSLGYRALIDMRGLQGAWAYLAALPVFPFTRFYNTLIMGGLILSIVLAFPVFWGIKGLIIGYRERYQQRVQNWKFVKILKGSTFFRLLSGVGGFGGGR
jgi:uncharacterized protein (TIGR03546 family)